MRVLVAYASRHGATRGIAEHIAETLRQDGLDVTVSDVENVDDIRPYDAFVVGAAAYMFHWLKEAAGFVRENNDALATHPTWLFSSGPLGRDLIDAKGNDVVAASLPREFPEFERAIKPRDEHIFFGAYDPNGPPAGFTDRFMKGWMKIMPAMRDAIPTGDFRDWPAIDEWAHGIARELQVGESSAV